MILYHYISKNQYKVVNIEDNLEKFDVIRVREGGKLDILKSQYSKGVITFETTPALGAYLIISY